VVPIVLLSHIETRTRVRSLQHAMWHRSSGDPHPFIAHLDSNSFVRFEVFTAVTMKNGDFWDVTQCGSYKSRRFGGTWRFLHQDVKNR
jgi:hypothetical protein